MKRAALALSALLLATPAMADSSLRTAAITAAGVEVCGAEVAPGVLRALVTRGSEEGGVSLEQAAFITLGMKLAYLDIIARTNTAAEFCSASKQARAAQ